MTEPTLMRAVRRVERTSALDGVVARARGVASRILPNGQLRSLLQGEPLGHPLHPVAVLVPAGAWISAAVLDFLPGQERAARALVGVGVLSAAPAALSGIADWSTLREKQQRVGVVHWAANLLAVGLYSASYVERRRGNTASGRAFGLVGLGVIGLSGYLGGHLAYRQGANVHVEAIDVDMDVEAGS